MVVDFWVNAVDPRRFLPSMTASAQPPAALPGVGVDGTFALGRFVEDTVAAMDLHRVDVAILCTGLTADGSDPASPSLEALLEATAAFPERFLVSGLADRVADPVGQGIRLRELAVEPRVALARVVPMLDDVPLDDRRWYPLYAACAEVGLPVSINVGLPGYARPVASQHPERLPVVLCDLPGLHVVAAHMGHPYEELLVGLLRLFPQLSLATTLFWPRQLHPAVRTAMAGAARGQVIWGSDTPAMDLARQREEVDGLELDTVTREAYLGGAWERVAAAARRDARAAPR